MRSLKPATENTTARHSTYLLLLIAMFIASCGGEDSSNSSGVSPNPAPPPSSGVGTTTLKVDAGAVCETLLTGEAYTSTPPALACNNGADPYTAYLDGNKSTPPDGETLGYAWSFDSKPAGSNAHLSGADTVNPTFVPDKAGPYVVQLVVSAGGVSSSRAVTLVVALDDAALNPNRATDPSASSYHFHGGLSSDCVQCHAANTALPPKPSTHAATSSLCQACHSPLGFRVVSAIDHAEAFGECSSCHDGVSATGKSDQHIPTTQDCSVCHDTKSFVTLNPDGSFDHSGVTGGCSACHNGTVATGTDSDPSPTGHPTIASECNDCHTTETFTTPFPNHADPQVVVPGTCGQAGCHDGLSVMSNGVAITGKNSAPNPHPDTGNITQACDLCHNTTSYDTGGEFDHGVLARHPIACKSCHDGLSATGMIQGHIPVAQAADCGNCHNTSTFVGGFVDHTSSTVTSQQCTDCHDGAHTWSFVDSTGTTTTLPIPGTPTTPQVLVDIHAAAAGQSCDNCHAAGESFTLATVDHSGFGSVGNITLPAQYTGCEECHNNQVSTGKPSGHLETTQDCGVCHDPQRSDWLGAGFDHSSVSVVSGVATPACSSCHDGALATGQSLTHVPEPTSGQDCVACHGTGFTSFAMPTFDHAAAGIADNCTRCHDGKVHDSVTVISKPATHIPTSADCSICHADTNNGPGINGSVVSGFTVADPFVNTAHPAYATGCRGCHNGSYDNSIYGAKGHPSDSVHATVDSNGWECNACHTTTGNFMETDPVNHQDAAVMAQPCVSCHVDGNTSGAIGKGPGHPSTSDVCQDCHQAGGSFVAGFDHTTLNAGGANQGLACTSCHDGVTATGKSQNHVPTNRDCLNCHAGYPPVTSSFAGGTFDHSGPEMLGKQCMQCHDGVVATGKSQTHIATSADCGACHSTTTFANATGFDHTGVTSGCQDSGCHYSGNPSVTDVTDDPNPLSHIPIENAGSEVDCYACHKNAGGTFTNATMDHSVVTFEACESCHDGNHDGSNAAHIVTTQSSTHMITSLSACASCHTSTTAWTSITYRHTGSGYPGDHSSRRITTCTQCHSDTHANEDISTFPSTALASDGSTPYGSTCAACHERNSHHGRPVPVKYLSCGKSGCHRVSSSSF